MGAVEEDHAKVGASVLLFARSTCKCRVRLAQAVLVLLAFCIAPAIAQTPGPESRVEGILVNQVTGQPLANGTLTLQKLSGASKVPDADTHTTRSNVEGRFVFEKLEPGRYALTGSKSGFLRGEYRTHASATIDIQAGEAIRGLKFVLQPLGVIAGQVLDENGDAITMVRVRVLRQGYLNGRRHVFSTALPTAVDEQGRFRIANLIPGRYLIAAALDHRETEPSANGQAAYIPTYYRTPKIFPRRAEFHCSRARGFTPQSGC